MQRLKDYRQASSNIESGNLLRQAEYTDADLQMAKAVAARTKFVQHVYNGDIEEALSDIPWDGGHYHKTVKPALDPYGAAEYTELEFRVSEDGEITGVSGWHSYDTETLLNAVMTETTPKGLEEFNEELFGEEQVDATGTISYKEATQADTIKLLETGKYPEIGTKVGDYLGGGYTGPYSGSSNWAGSGGMEYIETDQGYLIRIGRGYESLDNDRWSFYTGELDSALLALDPDSGFEVPDIFGQDSGSSDLSPVVAELNLLLEVAWMVNDQLEEMGGELEEALNVERRRVLEEEGGQLDMFKAQK